MIVIMPFRCRHALESAVPKALGMERDPNPLVLKNLSKGRVCVRGEYRVRGHWGSIPKSSWTCRTSGFMRRRMSVMTVASQTRAPPTAETDLILHKAPK